MRFNIDSAIFVIFLMINLAFGLWSGRGIKNIKDYALGGRNFSTATIASTIIATWIFGSSFALNLSETYSKGLYFIIPAIADAFSFFIVAYFYAPRMSEFLGQLSVAECMGSLYGKNLRIITSISAIIPAIGNISIQFTVLALTLNHFLGSASSSLILIISLIIILYSTVGGIKAVTFTDMIQFFTFGVVIPLVAFIIWQSIEHHDSVYEVLTTNPNFDIKEVFDLNNSKLPNVILIFLFFLIPGLDPAIFQRISMAKNTIQVSRSFYISGIIIACLYLILDFTGLLLLAVKAIDLNQDNAVNYVLQNFIPVGLKGIFISGMMSMIISTADSYINTTAILFTHDFCKPLGLKLSAKQELRLVRISSLLLGIMALVLSTYSKNLLDIILSTYSFYMPIVSVPLLLAIFGFRSSSRAVLIGMSAGLTAVVYTKIYSEFDSIIAGMIANLLFFISFHYLLKERGGFIGIKDNAPLIAIRMERIRRLEEITHYLKSFSLTRFLKDNLPSNEKLITYLGFFCTMSVLTNMYSMSENTTNLYRVTLTSIYTIALLLSTTLITYPFWLAKFRSAVFIAILWNITIFFNLAFINTLFVLFSKFNSIQIIIQMANLIVIAILMRWKTAILIIIVGVVSGIKFYLQYWGNEFLQDDMIILQFKITYILLLIISMLITFLKPKQEYLEATEHKVGTLETEVTHLGHEVTTLNEQVSHYNERLSDQEKEIERLGATTQKILNNVNHELRLPIGNVVNFSDMLNDALEKSGNKHVQLLSKEVYDNSNRVSSMILNMLDLATLDVKKVDLQKKTVNFSEMVEYRVKTCRKIYLQNKKIDFELTIEPEIMIAVDPNYIRQTIDNLVINAINFSESGLIKVTVARQDRQVVFTIIDQGKGIPPLELNDIFTPFKMGSNTESKACGRGIGLALCKSTVEAHGGSITADSNGKVGATIRFILPL